MQKINQHYTKEQEIEKKYSRNNQSPDDLTCYLVFALVDFSDRVEYCQSMYDKYAFTPAELKSRLRHFYNNGRAAGTLLMNYLKNKNITGYNNDIYVIEAAIYLQLFVS